MGEKVPSFEPSDVNRQECEVEYSPPSIVEIKCEWSCILLPLYTVMGARGGAVG
jgi:hypothetical protein